MKIYKIYHVVSWVVYRYRERPIFPRFITKKKKCVATFRDKEAAKYHLDILKTNKLENRSYINYEIIDDKVVYTDSHSCFYYIEEVDENNQYLKPCPFCGDKEPIISESEDKYSCSEYYVVCRSCGARTGSESYPEDVVDAWNARVN